MSDHGGTISSIATGGSHSLAEILSQTQYWGRCLQEMRRHDVATKLRDALGDPPEWLFIGCGSSFYIALAAASCWNTLTAQPARAIPASELLLDPGLVSRGSEKLGVVLISRSGTTSETVKAAEILRPLKNIGTLSVTETQGAALDGLTTAALGLPPCEEESTVMTRSFSSMLLSLQYLAAGWAGDKKLREALEQLPAAAGSKLPAWQPQIQEFVEGRQFADYVCLGQGPYFGLACETALKITEMSVSYAQHFHTLEFRHGPKSIVSPATLLVFLLSEFGHNSEVDVLEEMKGLGATILTVTNHADKKIRASSDLVLELGLDLPELARIVPYVFAGQLLGLYTGIKKGLDPDNPRHLSRVVMLR